MTLVRVCVLAGLMSAIAAMLTEAFAQDCPQLFKWACSGSISSTAATTDVIRKEKRLSKTKVSSRSARGDGSKQAKKATAETVNLKSPQAQPTELARSGVDRLTQNSDPLGGDREGTAMSSQEKETLFRDFLEWKKAKRFNTGTDH
jgi:hypothetical protein